MRRRAPAATSAAAPRYRARSAAVAGSCRGLWRAARGARLRLVLQARETEPLALRVVRLGDALGDAAHAQDVALALSHANRAARVEQVERVRRLADLLVRGQRQVRGDQFLRFRLA